MGKNNFIEINGKRYDTTTGKLIVDPAQKNSPVTIVAKIQPIQNKGVVDGFVKRSARPARQGHSSNVALKHPQKSKTLMRNAVTKPSQKVSVQQTNSRLNRQSQISTAHNIVSPQRANNAQSTPKSPHIQKFNHLEVPKTPVYKANTSKPKRLEPSRVTQVASVQRKPSLSKNASHKIIESALNNAKSHEELHKNPVKIGKKQGRITKKLGISRKLASLSSGALAVVLLAGFFAVQNIPALSMKVAASRAGFNASLPGYSPSGFAFKGPINYDSGQVTVSFHSNVDERSYNFVQKSSNWNSEALVANFLEPENKNYQTYLDRGRTLYIYDNSNATWVDDGVWYKIEGQSNMTSDQIIRIVNSV